MVNKGYAPASPQTGSIASNVCGNSGAYLSLGVRDIMTEKNTSNDAFKNIAC